MTSEKAYDHCGSVNTEHRREGLITLGWSEIIGGYNTVDTMVDRNDNVGH